MANKIIRSDMMTHSFDTISPYNHLSYDGVGPEVRPNDKETDSVAPYIGPRRVVIDKGLSISELSDQEMSLMIRRLEMELALQAKIRELRRNAGEIGPCEFGVPIDTTTPINQLYHHGVLGMKWGRRRYQNKDGSLTAAGKARYGPDKNNKGEVTSEGSKDYRRKSNYQGRGIKNLSNSELRALNDRLRLEDEYARLTGSGQVKRGRDIVRSALVRGGEQALADVSKGIFTATAKLLIKQTAPDFAKYAFKDMKSEKKEKD